MQELINQLKHLGLSDKESAVYLASLELGPAPVQDIAHKSKVNRATTYVMIESLSARGLMSTFIKGKKRFYSPENPDRLLSIIQLQQRELQEKENDLLKTIPLLASLYNAEGAKPQIRYLEGVEGIETVRQIFQKLQGDYVQILPIEDVLTTEEFLHGREEHRQVMHEQHLRGKAWSRKLIVTKNVDSGAFPDVRHGDVKIIPYEQFPLNAEITVRNNYVFLFSYKSAVLALVIISQEIADAVRALFELAWKGAQEFPGKTFK